MSITDDDKQNGRQRAYDIATFCTRYGIGRTKVHEERKAGRLKVKHAGRRIIITDDDAEDWLKNLPD